MVCQVWVWVLVWFVGNVFAIDIAYDCENGTLVDFCGVCTAHSHERSRESWVPFREIDVTFQSSSSEGASGTSSYCTVSRHHDMISIWDSSSFFGLAEDNQGFQFTLGRYDGATRASSWPSFIHSLTLHQAYEGNWPTNTPEGVVNSRWTTVELPLGHLTLIHKQIRMALAYDLLLVCDGRFISVLVQRTRDVPTWDVILKIGAPTQPLHELACTTTLYDIQSQVQLSSMPSSNPPPFFGAELQLHEGGNVIYVHSARLQAILVYLVISDEIIHIVGCSAHPTSEDRECGRWFAVDYYLCVSNAEREEVLVFSTPSRGIEQGAFSLLCRIQVKQEIVQWLALRERPLVDPDGTYQSLPSQWSFAPRVLATSGEFVLVGKELSSTLPRFVLLYKCTFSALSKDQCRLIHLFSDPNPSRASTFGASGSMCIYQESVTTHGSRPLRGLRVALSDPTYVHSRTARGRVYVYEWHETLQKCLLSHSLSDSPTSFQSAFGTQVYVDPSGQLIVWAPHENRLRTYYLQRGGSLCTGCDGELNSLAPVDECGVCRGDSSTCRGCDSVLHSPLRNDPCGVCGGECETCVCVQLLWRPRESTLHSSWFPSVVPPMPKDRPWYAQYDAIPDRAREDHLRVYSVILQNDPLRGVESRRLFQLSPLWRLDDTWDVCEGESLRFKIALRPSHPLITTWTVVLMGDHMVEIDSARLTGPQWDQGRVGDSLSKVPFALYRTGHDASFWLLIRWDWVRSLGGWKGVRQIYIYMSIQEVQPDSDPVQNRTSSRPWVAKLTSALQLNLTMSPTCKSCDNTFSSTLSMDECNVCGGLGDSCHDCEGVFRGSKILDACDQCVNVAHVNRSCVFLSVGDEPLLGKTPSTAFRVTCHEGLFFTLPYVITINPPTAEPRTFVFSVHGVDSLHLEARIGSRSGLLEIRIPPGIRIVSGYYSVWVQAEELGSSGVPSNPSSKANVFGVTQVHFSLEGCEDLSYQGCDPRLEFAGLHWDRCGVCGGSDQCVSPYLQTVLQQGGFEAYVTTPYQSVFLIKRIVMVCLVIVPMCLGVIATLYKGMCRGNRSFSSKRLQIVERMRQ